MISAAKLYTYFVERMTLGKVSPKGWYPCDCPYCDGGRRKKKFAFKFEWDRAKCWECGHRSQAIEVVMDLEEVDYYRAKSIIAGQSESSVDFSIISSFKAFDKQLPVLLPKGFNSILTGDTVLGNRARAYLSGRGFNLHHLDMIGFGYCDEHHENFVEDYFGYIIMPFKRRGKLQYFIGREFLDPSSKMKYKNPSSEVFGIGKSDLLFNEDALDLYDRVNVLEGYFDGMILGKDSIATLGWSLSDTQVSKMINSEVKEFVFVPDKGFYKECIKTALNFIDHKQVYVVNMDMVLPDEPKKKDVNEIGKDLVLSEIDRTPVLTESMALKILMND